MIGYDIICMVIKHSKKNQRNKEKTNPEAEISLERFDTREKLK